MTDLTFEAWPKIARLNRGCFITEKIDGTNAAVIVTDDLQVGAQSRTRLITPEQDNYGFARWVSENAETLASLLGPGRHYGEWWGQGIQRRYGLDHKRFSLFNVSRWADTDFTELPNVGLVPTLYTGNFSTEAVSTAIERLRSLGSVAAPGFANPEGVVVYLSAARSMFKVTCEKDEAPKGVSASV